MQRNLITIVLAFLVVAQMEGCRRSVTPAREAPRDSGVAIQAASLTPTDTAQTQPPVKVVVPVPIWQTVGGPEGGVRYTHTATFAVSENPSDMYMSIQDHMITAMDTLRYRPFQGEGIITRTNCRTDMIAPINVAAKRENLVVAVFGYWESVGVRRIRSEIRLSFGRKKSCSRSKNANDLVACDEETIVAMKAKSVRKLSGRSADGQLVFHVEMDGDTIISTNPRGEWPCNFHVDP